MAEIAKLKGEIIAVDVTAAGSVEWHVQDAAGTHALLSFTFLCSRPIWVGHTLRFEGLASYGFSVNWVAIRSLSLSPSLLPQLLSGMVFDLL